MRKKKPVKASKPYETYWGMGSVIKDGGSIGAAASPSTKAFLATNILGELKVLQTANSVTALSEAETRATNILFDAWNHYAKATRGAESDNAVDGMFAAVNTLLTLLSTYDYGTAKKDEDSVSESKKFLSSVDKLLEGWVLLNCQTELMEIAKKTLAMDSLVHVVLDFNPEYKR